MPSGAQASHIGWDEETIWGTPVAPTKFAELVSEDLAANNPQGISEGARNVTDRRIFPNVKSAGGSFELELFYEGFLRLFEYLMGDAVTAAAGPSLSFKHTFKLQDAQNLGLTIEVERDKVAQRYEGCLISGATFNFASDQITRGNFNVIGQQGREAVTPGTFVAPPDKPVLHTHFSAEIDDVAVTLLAAELTIEQNLQADKTGVGTEDILKPVRAGKRTVSGTITVDLDDNAHLTKYLAGTLFKLELLHEGTVAIETTFFDEMNFTMTKCFFESHPDNIGGPGPIIVTLPFRAIFDVGATLDALQIEIQNSETAVA